MLRLWLFMDKVYVITICRNAGELLEPTMLSVMNQTYENLHYIIVDGGSTDSSIDVIQKYEDRLTAWVSEPDKGIYDAMNKGLRMAKSLLQEGECAWVNFMNAGDRFDELEIVQRLFGTEGALQLSEKRDSILVIGGNTRDYYNDGTYKIHYAESAGVLPYRLAFSHQSCFVRIGNVPSDFNFNSDWTFDIHYKFAADYNLLHDIYRKCGKEAFLIVNHVIACYMQDGSSSLGNWHKTSVEYLRIQFDFFSINWWKNVYRFLRKSFR